VVHGVNPLVTVITPTWRRHRLLLGTCMPSVEAQTYRPVEHLVVSDGPDPELAAQLAVVHDRWADAPEELRGPEVVFAQLPVHDPEPHWGHHARQLGLQLARGELIAYLDDDDRYRPEHVEVLARMFDAYPDIGFAYSQMFSHGSEAVIGADPPYSGGIGTPMIMHRAGTPANWGPASSTEDWYLVSDWLAKGIGYRSVPQVTVDVWPSMQHPERYGWNYA
jgi:Glycosyl transferase family 2